MGTKLFLSRYCTASAVLEQCNSIWVQNARVGEGVRGRVLEQCNSIWVQNIAHKLRIIKRVLEQCNSIWVQNFCKLIGHETQF